MSIADLASPTVHILLHSLMPGNGAFRTTACMGYLTLHSDTRCHMWECFSCVDYTWAECMHIRTGNGRESTQIERKQENEAPQILGCDTVYNTVRNSR